MKCCHSFDVQVVIDNKSLLNWEFICCYYFDNITENWIFDNNEKIVASLFHNASNRIARELSKEDREETCNVKKEFCFIQ